MKYLMMTLIFTVGMNGGLQFFSAEAPLVLAMQNTKSLNFGGDASPGTPVVNFQSLKRKNMNDSSSREKTGMGGQQAPAPQSIHEFKVPALEGGEINFSDFKGQKILVVNTASECGYTPQYKLLEELYLAKKDHLVIVGFPANDFGHQEPGTNEDIAAFCQKNYGVTFPMAAKVSVKGEGQHEIFRWLLAQDNPDFTGEIQWNFEKFLLDENGQLIHRFRSAATPADEVFFSAIEGR